MKRITTQPPNIEYPTAECRSAVQNTSAVLNSLFDIRYFLLCIFIFLTLLIPNIASASGGVRYRTGTVAAKGVVFSESGNPIWVEYDQTGNIVANIGEAAGDLADAAVLPAATIQVDIDSCNEIKSLYRNRYEVLSADQYEFGNFQDALGQNIIKPALKNNTVTVIVRKAEILFQAADLILLESPLNLAARPSLPADARAVLLNGDM